MSIHRTSDGACLTYHLHGTGETTLVLLHGWLADGSIWRPLTEILSRRYRVVTIDLRGSGASREAPGPYCLETFARDTEEILRAIAQFSMLLRFDDKRGMSVPSSGSGIEASAEESSTIRRSSDATQGRYVLIGHSSGAQIAQRVALDAGTLVQGLVLIAPVPADGWRFPPHIEAFMREIAVHPEQRARWFATLLGNARSPEYTMLLQAAAETVRPEVALASWESWTHAHFGEAVRRLRIPTLVIAPEHDRPITPSILRDHCAELPNVRCTILRDAKHYAHLDQPERCARLITTFIQEDLRKP